MPVYFTIEEPLTADDQEAIIKLYSELSPDKPAISKEDVVAVWMEQTLMLAREQGTGTICGMAVLATYRKLAGVVGVMEEVVVAKHLQGEGVGAALIGGIIGYGKRLGLVQIDLTSRPDRFEANKLYQRFGFKRRETNNYRLVF